MAAHHVGEGDRANAAGRTAVVDQGAAVVEGVGRQDRCAGAPRREHGHGDQPAHLAGEAGDHARTVVVEIGGGRASVDAAQVGVAAEHVGVPVPVALAGGEHGPAGRRDRAIQRQVLVLRRGLGELDVVDDLPRAGGVQAADRTPVQRARERPLLAQHVEALGVDRDHDHVVGSFDTAHVEARLDGGPLQALEGARGLHGGPAGERRQRDAPERADAVRERTPGAWHAGLASGGGAPGSARRRRGRCSCPGWSRRRGLLEPPRRPRVGEGHPCRQDRLEWVIALAGAGCLSPAG